MPCRRWRDMLQRLLPAQRLVPAQRPVPALAASVAHQVPASEGPGGGTWSSHMIGNLTRIWESGEISGLATTTRHERHSTALLLSIRATVDASLSSDGRGVSSSGSCTGALVWKDVISPFSLLTLVTDQAECSRLLLEACESDEEYCTPYGLQRMDHCHEDAQPRLTPTAQSGSQKGVVAYHCPVSIKTGWRKAAHTCVVRTYVLWHGLLCWRKAAADPSITLFCQQMKMRSSQ